jgi:hypothetical protein
LTIPAVVLFDALYDFPIQTIQLATTYWIVKLVPVIAAIPAISTYRTSRDGNSSSRWLSSMKHP